MEKLLSLVSIFAILCILATCSPRPGGDTSKVEDSLAALVPITEVVPATVDTAHIIQSIEKLFTTQPSPGVYVLDHTYSGFESFNNDTWTFDENFDLVSHHYAGGGEGFAWNGLRFFDGDGMLMSADTSHDNSDPSTITFLHRSMLPLPGISRTVDFDIKSDKIVKEFRTTIVDSKPYHDNFAATNNMLSEALEDIKNQQDSAKFEKGVVTVVKATTNREPGYSFNARSVYTMDSTLFQSIVAGKIHK